MATGQTETGAKSTWKGSLFRIGRVLAVAYVGILLVLLFLENTLVYRGVTAAQHWQSPPSADVLDVQLTAEDGTRLHGWWCPCPPATGALLYFHGNAGNLSHRGGTLLKMKELLQVGVLIVDYPGYGKSQGSPSEAGCYAAGEAAYQWLVQEQKIDPAQVLIYGGSMGGGIAVDLASRREHRALILAKTFTSMPDVAQSIYPWLPVRWFMRNRFDNLSKISKCTHPVFIGHGRADDLVPFAQGQKLFEAANEPKEFFDLPGGHNDSLPGEFFLAFKKFMSKNAVVQEISGF